LRGVPERVEQCAARHGHLKRGNVTYIEGCRKMSGNTILSIVCGTASAIKNAR
jgi:hypothetical protein